MVQIVLVSENQLTRHSIRALLETETDLSVLAETDNAADATKLVQHLHPDILFLALMADALKVTRQVTRTAPKTGVIVLSNQTTENNVLPLLRAGAKAYVLESSNSNEILHAVRNVTSGYRYLDQSLLQRAIEAYIKTSPPEQDPANQSE